MQTTVPAGTSPILNVCAWAAIIGGALRVADVFIGLMSAVRVQQVAYFVTDLMLILGLCGVYFVQRKTLKAPGFFGFAIAVTGLLIVRTTAFFTSQASSYLIGALVTLIGVVVMGTVMLVRATFPKLAPVLWIASLAVGLVGLLSARLSWAVALAGLAFGIGFIAAGIGLLRIAPQRAH